MNNKEFKNLFGEIAITNGFNKAFGGWFNESNESIVVLELQKSNFGDYYELNIKIYIQGIFDKIYTLNKDLVKKDTGDVFRRHPQEYKNVFDLDAMMEDVNRREGLKSLFSDFIVPFTNEALTRAGIKRLAKQGLVFLLPLIKEQLNQ